MPRAKTASSKSENAKSASSKEEVTGRSRSRVGEDKEGQAAAVAPESQPAAPAPEPTAEKAPGRNENGQFAKGNPGGPGNPFARQTARMLQAFRYAFTDKDLYVLACKLRELAQGGNPRGREARVVLYDGQAPRSARPRYARPR